MDQVIAATGLGQVGLGLLVDLLGDDLDPVCVIEGELGVEGGLGLDIDASVCDSDGTEGEGLCFLVADAAVGDAFVLVFEVGEDSGCPEASVLQDEC